jgi:hypothetical protein
MVLVVVLCALVTASDKLSPVHTGVVTTIRSDRYACYCCAQYASKYTANRMCLVMQAVSAYIL